MLGKCWFNIKIEFIFYAKNPSSLMKIWRIFLWINYILMSLSG